jgi:hypothetical protein
VGTSHGILPHVANNDNRSARVLICKCSLLCHNIPTATHTRNSTAPSLLCYGLVISVQQRSAFSNDTTGFLYRVHVKTSREIYSYVVETVSKTTPFSQQVVYDQCSSRIRAVRSGSRNVNSDRSRSAKTLVGPAGSTHSLASSFIGLH